jgi:hypothetical protein
MIGDLDAVSVRFVGVDVRPPDVGYWQSALKLKGIFVPFLHF